MVTLVLQSESDRSILIEGLINRIVSCAAVFERTVNSNRDYADKVLVSLKNLVRLYEDLEHIQITFFSPLVNKFVYGGV